MAQAHASSRLRTPPQQNQEDPLVGPEGGGAGQLDNSLLQEMLGQMLPGAYRAATTGAGGALPYQDRLERCFGQSLADVPAFMGQKGLMQAGASAVAGPQGLAFADSNPAVEEVGEEVAHWLQSAGTSRAAAGTISQPDQPSEREAKGAGRKVAAGQSASVSSTQNGLQCNLLSDAKNGIKDAINLRENEEMLDAQEDLDDFRQETFAPLEDFQPSSGIGQFDTAFNAKTGQMTVSLKVSYQFEDGDPTAVAPGFKPEEFQWTDAEKDAWKARYQADVGAMWSGQHQIHSTRSFWDSVLVNVSVQVLEDASDPHFEFHVKKYPLDAGMAQSSICQPGYEHNNSGSCSAHGDGHGTGELDNNDLREEQKLDWGNSLVEIHFPRGHSRLNAAGKAELAPVADQMNADVTTHAELTGRASSDHGDGVTAAEGAAQNMEIARARSESVAAAIGASGVNRSRLLMRNEGENGASDDESWCRVDVQVGAQQTQNPALHETGHMLGLGDEYGTTAAPVGSPVDAGYDAMVQAQTGTVLARARDESAMSVGSTVKPWHYSSFLEALKRITGMNEWSV